MNWESEFTSQWQTFMDILETNIRRQVKSNGSLNSAFVNTVIKNEVEKWSNSNHFNGAWLRKLNREKPSLYEQFRTTLDTLHSSSCISFNNPSIILSVMGGIGICVILIIFGFLHLLVQLGFISLVLKQEVLTTALASIIILPILKNIETKERENQLNQLIDNLQQDLNFTGEKLREIAAKAEEKLYSR
ncbi:hypothetical protein [Okeania sp. KiyG1]|uniref:hypothetical protein n=1 Tax=Okeania sp. KiyG1 TaxID=2720165 RepID=UPI001922C81A|nr:hypothetical protein [Okeania sp. KiyG1]